MSVCNALSDVFKITSFRSEEQTKHSLEFNEGVMIKDVVKPNKNGKHGSEVEFRTSRKYMGEECDMPIEDVISWIETLFYLNSDNLKKKGIVCKVQVYNGMELENTFKFKPKPFSELINMIIPASIKKKQMTDLCSFEGNTKFVENSKVLVENDDGTTSVDNVDIEKEIHMDVAFQYCLSPDMNDSATFDTYCNYTNTIENGVHLEAFDEAFCRYMQFKVNASMSDGQKDKLKITWDDIRTNLFCVINLSTNAYVGFVGNAKTRISNRELIPYMKDIITEGLDKFFSKNQELLNTFVKLIKLNAKARLEAQKAKTATQTERLNTFKEHKLRPVLLKLS